VGGAWRAGPYVALSHTDVALDGYQEAETTSTAMTFGDQDYIATVLSAGLEAVSPPGQAVQARLRVAYATDLRSDDRRITLTPAGAPISWTTDALTPDPHYVEVSASLSVPLGARTEIGIGVEGRFDRADMDDVQAGLTLRRVF
jgi:outer membrane lipase/esterase